MDTRTIVVIAVALVACAFDIRTRRIPNALTLGAGAAALIFSLAQGGPSAAAWSAGGWLAAALLFIPFYALGGMGGGDVKLLGALGAWLGAEAALRLAFSTAIAGGVMGLLVVLARGYATEAIRNLWVLLTYWRVGGLRPHPALTIETSVGPRLAYAIPIATGAMAALWWR